MADVNFDRLMSKDLNDGYKYLLELEEQISSQNDLYPYYHEFLQLVHHDKSYVRVRGFRLCCALSKWDLDSHVDATLDQLLSVLNDDKPTNIRQFLMGFNVILFYQPHLYNRIIEKIDGMNLSKFKDTIKPLIEKDILALKAFYQSNN